MTFANGNLYAGEYKYDKANGQGTFKWSDGNIYKGEFKDGNKHGQGTFTWASRDVLSDTFKDDYFVQGVLTDSDGLSYDSSFTYTGSKSQYGTNIYNVTRISRRDGSVTSGSQYNNYGRLVFTPDQIMVAHRA